MSQLRDTDVNVASNVDTDTDTDDESDPFDYPEVVKAIERCIELDSDFSVMQAAKIADEMLPDKDEEPKLRNGTSLLLAEHILTVAMKIPYDNPSQIKLALYVQCMMQSQKLGGYAAENTFDSGESYVNHFRDNWETFWWTIREGFPGDACSDDEDVNFSAFCARLYGMNVDGWGTDPTYFMYALDYLECDMRIQGGGTERAIRSAALWVLYSGQFGFDAVVKWPKNLFG